MDLRSKIRSRDEIARLLGPRPRDRKAIMVHGVFDLVHPGHIRHLMFARSKADVLVASITADGHVHKGNNRPHVPQELRALNLAALQMVDHVLIDGNDSPLESIAALQPDYFAKGYEYAEAGSSKTADEAAAVGAYGGEMLFTPGDVVYSSSRLLEAAAPRLAHEKLLATMEREELTFAELRRILGGMDSVTVHVVGDTIVDSLTHTSALGSRGKTPTLSVIYGRREDYLGGAGVVARHLRAAGAEVIFSTVLGDDEAGRFARRTLQGDRILVQAEAERTRPTTRKDAIVCGGQRLLKVDTVDNRSISDTMVETLSHCIAESKADAFVFSDFRHGIFNRRTIPALCAAIPAGRLRVADSQVASRWGNVAEFQGFDLVTPNEQEARFALGDQDSGIRPLAAALYDAARCGAMIMKLGEHGVLACKSGDHEALDSFFLVDAFALGVVDPVGAGDALLAYATLALKVSGSLAAAAILGSVAAALECECEGNRPVGPAEMLMRLLDIERHTSYEVK